MLTEPESPVIEVPRNDAGQREAHTEPSRPTDLQQHRLEARRLYRACPPFRVRFRQDGRAVLEHKDYSYDEDRPPTEAIKWRVVDDFADLDAAERRIRLLCVESIHYYDARGQIVAKPPQLVPALWPEPPDDSED